MLKVACVGLWLALCASFTVSAGIIGMPMAMVLFEIVRASTLLLIAIGAGVLINDARHEFHASRRPASQVWEIARPIVTKDNAVQ